MTLLFTYLFPNDTNFIYSAGSIYSIVWVVSGYPLIGQIVMDVTE